MSSRSQLGERTDTGDADGEVVETAPVPTLDAAATSRRCWRDSAASQQQVPPMYSALKRDGQPLVRAGAPGRRSGARRAYHRHLARWSLVGSAATSCDSRCDCSKGTYIRVLGEDIARALGTVGHLTPLAPDLGRAVPRHAPWMTLEAVLAGAAASGSGS